MVVLRVLSTTTESKCESRSAPRVSPHEHTLFGAEVRSTVHDRHGVASLHQIKGCLHACMLWWHIDVMPARKMAGLRFNDARHSAGTSLGRVATQILIIVYIVNGDSMCPGQELVVTTRYYACVTCKDSRTNKVAELQQHSVCRGLLPYAYKSDGS